MNKVVCIIIIIVIIIVIIINTSAKAWRLLDDVKDYTGLSLMVKKPPLYIRCLLMFFLLGTFFCVRGEYNSLVLFIFIRLQFSSQYDSRRHVFILQKQHWDN